MNIENDKVATIEYTLKDSGGEIIDSSEDGLPLEYIHGHHDIIPGLEQALLGKKAGDTFSVVVEPKDGYGEHDKELIVELPKETFPADLDIKVGIQLEADTEEGVIPVTVINIAKDIITVDANHPLAGEKLFFEIKVVGVRDATEDELENGLYDDCDCGCDHSHCGDDCDCGCH